MAEESKQKLIIGIDKGGTKLFAAGYLLADDGSVNPKPVFNFRVPSHKGKAPLMRNLETAINGCVERAEEGAYSIESVGVALPCRFQDEDLQTIMPHSGVNMPLPRYPEVFWGQNIGREFNAKLAKSGKGDMPPVYFMNDAFMQAEGSIEDILRERSGLKKRFLNKTVGYLGLGSGLGGALLTLDGRGKTTPALNSHLYDVLIKLDPTDMRVVKKYAEDNEYNIEGECGQIFANTLLSGKNLDKLLGISDATELDNHAQPGQKYHEILEIAGRSMAKLIQTLNSGKSRKAHNPYAPVYWPPGHLKKVENIETFIIGGGLGGSVAGEVIIEEARRELEKMGLANVKLMMGNAQSAARAAAEVGYEQTRPDAQLLPHKHGTEQQYRPRYRLHHGEAALLLEPGVLDPGRISKSTVTMRPSR